MVTAYVARNTAKEDHRDHDAEEDHDDQRVHQTEPMDTRVKDVKIVIPASGLNEDVRNTIPHR